MEREKQVARVSSLLGIPVYGCLLDKLISGWAAWFEDAMQNINEDRRFSAYDEIVKDDLIEYANTLN